MQVLSQNVGPCDLSTNPLNCWAAAFMAVFHAAMKVGACCGFLISVSGNSAFAS